MRGRARALLFCKLEGTSPCSQIHFYDGFYIIRPIVRIITCNKITEADFFRNDKGKPRDGFTFFQDGRHHTRISCYFRRSSTGMLAYC